MAYVRVDGIDTFHEVRGSGEPVLLLHGGFCNASTMRPQVDALAPRFAVHVPERPGHGRTADRPGPMSPEQNLADAIGYLDAVGLDAVHVVGHSDGAVVGLLMAMHRPERIRSLVAVSVNLDPTGFVDTDVDTDAEVDDEINARLVAEQAALSPDGPEHVDVVVEKLSAMWAAQHLEASDLAAVATPTLVMAGSRDLVRVDHTELVAASIPGARLRVVEGAGHMLMEKRSDDVNAEILDFLASVAR